MLVKYWPLAVVIWLVVVVGLLGVATVSLVRLRMSSFQHWPYWIGGFLLLIGSGLVVGWANRPAFLTASKPQPSAATVEEFEAHAEGLLDEGATPGLSVLVLRNDQVLYDGQFGVANAAGDPVTADTIYHWWSVTKVFTAVAILQLVDDGLIELDDPVTDYVDVSSGPLAGSSTVTIHQLLTHSSGLPDAGSEILGWVHFEGDAALDQTELARSTLADLDGFDAEPGAEGRYTNIGYMALSAVIENVTGLTYEEYVTVRILEPLGMRSTGFVAPNGRVLEANGSHPVDAMTIMASLIVDLDRAVAVRADGRDWFERVYPDQTAPSGLIGSPSDMARFLAALANEGMFEDVRILSAESVRAMNTRYVDVTKSPAPIDGLGFGYAWFHDTDDDGRTSLTHGGQGIGTASMVRLYPDEDLAIIIVSNSTYLGARFGLDEIELLGRIDWTDDEP